MKVSSILVLSIPCALLAACSPYHSSDYGDANVRHSDVISSRPATTVSTVARTDANLESELREAIRRESTLSNFASQLQVDADNGIVTLEGTVPNQDLRNTVVSLVRNTPGVRGVTDRLYVTSTAQTVPVPSHAPATGGTADPVSSAPVAIPTYSHNRAVGADVDNEQRRDIVTDSARASSAVSGQVFSMQVDSLTSTDRNLAQKILAGLRTDSALAELLPKVVIHVADGQVVLQGVVQNDEQRRSIGDAVRRASGVDIDNQLQSRPARVQ